LPVLYRQAVSSLAVARETSLDAATLAYLEGLVRRAWFQVYGPRTSFGAWLRRFLTGGWSAAVRTLWLDLCIAAAVMVAGTLAGWLLVARDPEWYYALVGEAAQGRTPGAGREALAETLKGTASGEGLTVFAAYLFSNNSGVTIMAFALGFAFGIPTLLLLIHNTAMLGAMLWVFAEAGLGWEFAAWLSIHGTTEVGGILLGGAAGIHIGRSMAFPGERAVLRAASEAGWRSVHGTTEFGAILPGGAAGIHIGRSMAFPGERAVLASASEAGRLTAQVMVGAVLMLVVARLLEGYGRQLIEDPIARGAVGGTMLVVRIAYFLVGRRRPAPH